MWRLKIKISRQFIVVCSVSTHARTQWMLEVTRGNLFLPPTVWVQRIEPRPSGLAVSAFPCLESCQTPPLKLSDYVFVCPSVHSCMYVCISDNQPFTRLNLRWQWRVWKRKAELMNGKEKNRISESSTLSLFFLNERKTRRKSSPHIMWLVWSCQAEGRQNWGCRPAQPGSKDLLLPATDSQSLCWAWLSTHMNTECIT